MVGLAQPSAAGFRAAAEGDWQAPEPAYAEDAYDDEPQPAYAYPEDAYAGEGAYPSAYMHGGAYEGEDTGCYDMDSELQEALELDDSQGLFEAERYDDDPPPIDPWYQPAEIDPGAYYGEAEDSETQTYQAQPAAAASWFAAPAGQHAQRAAAEPEPAPSRRRRVTPTPTLHAMAPVRESPTRQQATPPAAATRKVRSTAPQQLPPHRLATTAAPQQLPPHRLAHAAPQHLPPHRLATSAAPQQLPPHRLAQSASAEYAAPEQLPPHRLAASVHTYARIEHAAPQQGFAASVQTQQHAAAQPRLATAARAGRRGTGASQLGQTGVRRIAGLALDDVPVAYPKRRGGGWLKAIFLCAAVAGAGYAYRDQLREQLSPHAKPPALPVAPPPTAAPVAPEPEPAAEPTPAAEVNAPLTPQEAKAQRSAARAALIRERRAARRAQAEDRDEPEADLERERPAARAPVEEAPPAPAQQPRRVATQSGTLRINSRPWSQIYIDGQPVGHTPQMNLSVPAGEHQITLINTEMELRTAISVQIEPNQITSRTVNLGE
jgi:hypothetical protein